MSNVVLDELDQELERRGHRFARYADDCNVYVASARAGERVMENIARFLERRLRLQINAQKSAVARPWLRAFLGFSFTASKDPRRRLAPETVGRFRIRVRKLTRRTRRISVEQSVEDTGRYLRGWRGYFGYCETPSVLGNLDGWLRRRLRACGVLEAVEAVADVTRRFAHMELVASWRPNCRQQPRSMAHCPEPCAQLCVPERPLGLAGATPP